MIDGKGVLGVIPARMGSKGVPRKNLRVVGGKALIAWSIEAALNASLVDRLVVDTDDEEIAVVARSSGAEVPFLRPADLASDTAPIVDCLAHLLDRIGAGFDYVTLLQCTSPLRTTDDIDAAILHCARSGARACVSVTAVAKPPQWMLWLKDGGRVAPLLDWDGFRKRRQDLPAAYLPNGALYVVEARWFRDHRTFFGPDTVAYVMPAERSLDIDTEDDLTAFSRTLDASSGERGANA